MKDVADRVDRAKLGVVAVEVPARIDGGSQGDATIAAEPASQVRIRERSNFGRTLGTSEVMRRLYPLWDRLAASAESVLIQGESGTGKELLAASLHEEGSRAGAPFVVIDCTFDASNLARRRRDYGVAFERFVAQALNGTLLLDEPGDLDAPRQRALAQALTTSSGAVRVVVASRKDLDWLMQHGRFRDDLYAKMSAARIDLPPLRARHGDVSHLARHFWIEGGGEESAFPADTIARAEARTWPGNVRELRELVSSLLAAGAEAGPSSPACPVPAPIEHAIEKSAELATVLEELLQEDVSYCGARRRLLVEFEQRYVERMLVAHKGNITRAAAASGLARRNFQLIRARKRDGR